MKISRKKVLICEYCGSPTKVNLSYDVPRIHYKNDIEFSGYQVTKYLCYKCNKSSNSDLLDDEYTNIANVLATKFNIELMGALILQSKELKYDIYNQIITRYKDKTYIALKNPLRLSININDINIFSDILQIFKKYGFSYLQINAKEKIEIHNFNKSEKKEIEKALFFKIYYDDNIIKDIIDSQDLDYTDPDSIEEVIDSICEIIRNNIIDSLKNINKDLLDENIIKTHRINEVILNGKE